MQISDTLTQLNIQTSDEHIRSHQADDPTSLNGDPVPWKMHLNSRCDTLATAHLRQQSKPTLLVPFLPASRVALAIKERSITRKLPAQIRQIGGSSLPYTNQKSQVQHMCRIHNWSTAQFHSIDWSSFHAITNVKSSFPNRSPASPTACSRSAGLITFCHYIIANSVSDYLLRLTAPRTAVAWRRPSPIYFDAPIQTVMHST
jgi:hypothetical protein